MEKGSIVAINYTGRIVVSGEIFESTWEKKAIEAGIFDQKRKHEPIVIVVGEGDVLPGIDKALEEMKAGEQREIKVLPEQGWGLRKLESIRVVPLQQFKKEKVNPFPGMPVELNGMRGKVQSVSGGRVRVDFNHPLAGKELLYDLKIERELKDPKEQVEGLYAKYFYMVPDAEKKLVVGKGEVEVTLSPRWSANIGPIKQVFSKIITKHVKGFEKVRFIEEFVEEGKLAEKQKKEPGKKTGLKEGAGREGKVVEEKKAGREEKKEAREREVSERSLEAGKGPKKAWKGGP